MASLIEDPGLPLHDVDVGSVPSNYTNLADSLSKTPGHPHYNAGVFWGVNCFIVFLICLSVLWCCFVQRHVTYGSDTGASDRFYRARLQRRREAANEDPEKRQRKLHQSFARHKVEMVSYFFNRFAYWFLAFWGFLFFEPSGICSFVIFSLFVPFRFFNRP